MIRDGVIQPTRIRGAGHAAAVLSVLAATLLRLALSPLIGEYTVPFITFFPAVLFSAWFGGFRAGLLAILLSTFSAAYFFTYSPHLWIPNAIDRITLLIFLVVGTGIALLSHSQRRALERADREASLRRDAELAERQERHRFETTLASIGDGVIATDIEGRVSFMNEVAEEMTGWKREEASGKPLQTVFQTINEETRKAVENPALRAMQEGRIFNLEDNTLLIARDGEEIPVDDSGSAIQDLEDRTVGSVLIFRDVTERRRLDRERKASLRVSRQLAAIVETCDDAILGKNLDLQITSWNRSAELMFGYTAAEAIGQSVRFIIPERRLNEEERVMQRIRRGEKVEHLETERQRRDGTVMPVLLTISPIRDAAGSVVGASTIVRDITERKRAAEAESQARRVAEEANRAKDEFLAVVSHELRNPLSAIIGWTAILKQQEVSLERVRHGIDVIERNARMEARLVESLLDFSRIAANKLDLSTERVNLSSLIREVVDSVTPAADAKGVGLNVTALDKPFVVGDSARLQQVFTNLLTNAIKFTPRNGHVEVRLSCRGSQAEVQVVDDGVGIAHNVLPDIFDRFRQADSAKGRAYGGLGLGLAIVRELVNAHGGSVIAESPGKGRGSTFTVTIPIPAVIPVHIKAPAAHPKVAEEPSISGLRILVVDDDPDARELVALTLDSRGARIRMAASSAEALESISREKPDVMVSDIGMPEEDGYALIQKVRNAEKQHALPRLPAIALTAFSGAADRDQALAAGFDMHLSKPVEVLDLIYAVAEVARTVRSGSL